jgi:aconitase A
MCVAANGEKVPPGGCSISSTNRNFAGRQGLRSRTLLASPAIIAAVAAGMDEPDVLLDRRPELDAFQRLDRVARSWIWPDAG